MDTNFSIRDLILFGAGGASVALTLWLSNGFSKQTTKSVIETTKKVANNLVTGKSIPRNPNWKVGENQPLPFVNKTFNSYSAKDLKASGGIYGLLISAVIPRPIALVSSHDSNGILNCAPYSYFNIVSHDPPLVVIGCCINGRTKTKKDTLNNIEQTGQFVVNIMSSWYVESANHTSGPFPPEVNEIELAGLSTLPSEKISPPRIGDAAIQFECEKYNLIPVYNDEGNHTVTLVVGRIVQVHVLQDVLSPGNPQKPLVDWLKLSPVARMGGETYTFVNNGFDLPRER